MVFLDNLCLPSMNTPHFPRLYPKTSKGAVILLVIVSSAQSTALGYDQSMMAGLNILPTYTEYFSLNTSTLAVQSSIVWIGCIIAGFFFGWVTDRIGRRSAIVLACIISTGGAVIQAAAQNIAMFLVGRFIVGLGNGAGYICAPMYLAETLPLKWRALGVGILMNFFYVGAVLAAGITYGTSKMSTTWAWRLPSALQGAITIVAVLPLLLVPESPRWLLHRCRHDEALKALALTHADGDTSDSAVTAVMSQMKEAMDFEAATQEQNASLTEVLKSKSARLRLALVASVAVIAMVSGNNIATFYLGSMLNNAGITSADTQLQINIYLNLWAFIAASVGTIFLDRFGRKPVAVISASLLTVFMFAFGAMCSRYGEASTDSAGIYGTVAVLFLFQAAFSVAWTPLATLYPPEVLNYRIRGAGLGFYSALTNACGLMVTMAFPYALEAITWKTYMINGAWNALQVLFVVFYWVETKGKSLEEIDVLFEGGAVLGGDVEVLEGVDVAGKHMDVIKRKVQMKIDEC